MSIQTVSSLVELHNPPDLTPQPPALHLKESHVTPLSKSDSSAGIELQSIIPAAVQTPSKTPSIRQESIREVPTPATPKIPSDLEQSRPPSPNHDRAADVVQSFWSPYMNRFRVVACCLMLIGNGLNDAAPGALLNYIET